ncbi:MAG: hypothetical protein BroJett040_24750 [Oligoflexia bacterium]|nr:MAG: hypothetical protein BroJett040_24750 [Oligoflexia bacterium]
MKPQNLSYTALIISLSFLWSCSPSGGGGAGGGVGAGGGTGGESSKPGAAIKMICNTEGSSKELRRFDFPTDELYVAVDLPQFTSGGLAKLNDKIWVTLNDNRLLKLNSVTHAIEETVVLGSQMTRLLTYGDELIIMDMGIGSKDSERQRVIRYNTVTKTHSEVKLGSIIQIYDQFRVIGDQLFVLSTNDFTLFNVDLKTNTAMELSLGEGGGYGYGNFVLQGDLAWVIDDYSNKMLKIDIKTMKLLSSQDLVAESYSSMEIFGEKIFVELLSSKKMGMISTSAPTVVNKIDVGIKPDGLLQQGQRLFVLGGVDGFGQITELDMVSGSIVQKDNGFYVDHCVVDM